MADWGNIARYDSFRYVLVDPITLAELRPLECELNKGSASFAYYTENKSQASLTVVGDDADEVSNKMVRVYHRSVCDGADVEECVGTFFVDDVGVDASNGIVKGDATCYGPLWRLSDDELLNDFALVAGRPKVDSIKDIVSSVGGTIVIGDGVNSSEVHEESGFIEMGTTVYKAVNQIAGSMGCRIDGLETGEILLEAYVDPSERPVKHEFVEGENCTAMGGLRIKYSGSHPVNRVKFYFSREHSNGDGYPRSDSYTAVLDPANPFSFENTGVWRTRIVKLDQPCSHAELEAKTKRYLSENSGTDVYLTFSHVGIPDHRTGDVVRYCSKTVMGKTLDVEGMVTETTIGFARLARTTTEIKVVRWR